jgi:hypothetical protein
MRPILDTADSGHAPIMDSDSGDRQRFWTHTNRNPVGTGPQSERPILDAHQSEPDVIQEVIQSNSGQAGFSRDQSWTHQILDTHQFEVGSGHLSIWGQAPI